MAEFTLFPKLPLELRRKVWRFAASTKRIIEIRWDQRLDFYYSSTPPPSVLHASRESRIEALMCYELLEMESCEKVSEELIDQDLESNATSVEETANGAQEPMNGAAEQMDREEEQNADEARSPIDATEYLDGMEYRSKHPMERLVCTRRGSGPIVFAMFRTYINYQRDTFYLSARHIDMPYITTPGEIGCFLQDFVYQASPPNDKLYRLALGYSEEDPEVDDHIEFLFRLPNLKVIYLVFLDRCCVDRNIPHINASHFTKPCDNLLNGEFRTSAKDVYKALLEATNELIEIEKDDSKRPLSGNDFTAWKDARERQWRDLKVIPKIISRS